MSTVIQIRNVPQDLRQRLEAVAAKRGVTLSAYVIAELTRAVAAEPTGTMDEFRARLATLEPLDVELDVVATLRAIRGE